MYSTGRSSVKTERLHSSNDVSPFTHTYLKFLHFRLYWEAHVQYNQNGFFFFKRQLLFSITVQLDAKQMVTLRNVKI